MTREYILRITNETSKEVGEKVGGSGGVKKTAQGSAGGEKNKKETKAKAALQTFAGINVVKSFALPVISHRVSTVQLRTGSREAQQRSTMLFTIGQKTFSAAESVAAGFVIGGGAGALAGLALSAIHTAMDFSLSVDRLNTQKQLEDISRDMSAVQRATVSGSRFQRG